MKYEFSKDQINNLLIFLDRAEIKGFQELNAMNEIINILQHPVQEKVHPQPQVKPESKTCESEEAKKARKK